MKYYFLVAIVCLLFISCEFSVKTYEKKTDTGNSKIRNGIQVEAKSVKLDQAFLLNEDGTLIPEDNKIVVGQKITLRLIANGWKEKEGRVYLEASLKATLNNGEILVNKANLFEADSIEWLGAEDAKYINLSFWITQINELFDYATVEFRVWDKMGEGVLTGSYKVYLK